MDPTPEQRAVLDAFTTGESVKIAAGAGSGKTTTLRLLSQSAPRRRGLYMAFNRALRNDQPVLTDRGWRQIGSINVGQRVIGSDGRPHKVTKVHPVGVRPLYRVVFDDGTEVIADAEHLWTTQTVVYDATERGGRQWKVRTTEQIAATLHQKHRVPLLTGPVQFAGLAPLPIHPYVLGALLGDGSFKHRSVLFASGTGDIPALIQPLLPPHHTIHRINGSRNRGWSIVSKGQKANLVRRALISLGLGGPNGAEEKFIPEPYLRGTPEARLELLRGLMDADGCAAGPRSIFVNTSKALVDGVVFLVQSLGGRCTVRTVDRDPEREPNWKTAYHVNIRLPGDMCPFAMERKRTAWRPRVHDHMLPRQIVAVDRVDDGEATCISVSADDRLFLTAGCVPTHNSIATDAQKSFPRSVTVKTTHALAFAAVGRRFRHRLDEPRQPYARMAHALGITDKLNIGEKRDLTPAQQARLAQVMVTNYCNSADDELTVEHLPVVSGLDPADRRAVGNTLLPHAQVIWQDWTAVNGNRFRYQHDAYLKLFALGGGRWGYDYLLFDEAQDSSPVVSKMVADQQAHGAQVVVVGDSAQSIYGWRGAVDAMSMFSTRHHLQLSQSFRFGPAVATEANKWLRFLGSPMTLRGFDQLQSVVTDDEVPDPDAILCRTNAGTIRQVMLANEQRRSVAIVGGGDDALRLAEAAADLLVGKPTSHPELALFPDWRAVQEYVEEGDAPDLRPFVQLIDEYTPPVIIRAIKQTVPERSAERIISTAHKSKGREWASVQIDDDFPEPRIDYSTGEMEIPSPEEAMLAYVAVTRAREVLARGSLSWIDQHAPGAPSQVTTTPLRVAGASSSSMGRGERPSDLPRRAAVAEGGWVGEALRSFSAGDGEWLQREAQRRGVSVGEVLSGLVAAQRVYSEAVEPRSERPAI